MVRLGEWLSEGWALIKDDIVTFAVATLLAGLIGGITFGICAAPLGAGLFMMLFAKMRGEPVAIGDVFKGFQKFGPAFVFMIVVGIAAGIASVVLNLIPVIGQVLSPLLGIVIGAAVFYSLPLIAATETGAMDAIKISWEKVQPNLVMYAVTYFVYSLVASIGVIACVVGIFVTQPLMLAAIAIAYRENFGLAGAAPAPAAPAVPPAPGMAPPPAAPPAAPPPPATPTAPPPPAPTPAPPPAPTPAPPPAPEPPEQQPPAPQ